MKNGARRDALSQPQRNQAIKIESESKTRSGMLCVLKSGYQQVYLVKFTRKETIEHILGEVSNTKKVKKSRGTEKKM